METDHQTRRVVVVVLGVAALAIVTVLAIALRRGPIEDDLTSRSESALAGAGIGTVGVTFEGRDGTLTGTVPSEADRNLALGLVDDLEGVRVVDGLLTVAPPTTTTTTSAAAAEASFSLVGSDAAVTLSGTVPDADLVTALGDAAAAAFGADAVANSLTIAPRRAP